jgi:hypothetical protein
LTHYSIICTLHNALPVVTSAAHVDITNEPPPHVQRHTQYHMKPRGKSMTKVIVCGAVELQCGIPASEPHGWCSLFIVFSEKVTNEVVGLGKLFIWETPKYQAQSDLKTDSWEELLAVVQELLGRGTLNYGTDYKVFALPARDAVCYVIAPGCLHAFFRHESFVGIVDRVWWETCGLLPNK